MPRKHKSRALELITRPNTAPEKDRGPYADVIDELYAMIDRYPKLLNTEKVGGSRIRYTDETRWTEWTNHSSSGIAAALHLDPDGRMTLSLDPNTSNRSMAQYAITRDGFASPINTGDAIEDAGLDQATEKLVPTALEKIGHSMWNKLERRRSHTRRRRIGAAITTGILGIAGAISGVAVTHHNTRLAEEAARAAYDDSNARLPGEGFSTNSNPIDSTSKADFETIPEYEDGDTFEHPRRLSITAINHCFALNDVTDLTETDANITALTFDGSIFDEASYSAAKVTNNSIEICISDLENPDSNSKQEIAFQVLPQS